MRFVVGKIAFGVMWVGSFIYGRVARFMRPLPGVVVTSRDDLVSKIEIGAVGLVGMAHVYWAGGDWSVVDPSVLMDAFISGQLTNGLLWMVAITLSGVALVVGGRAQVRALAKECQPTLVAIGTLLACGAAAVGATLLLPSASSTSQRWGFLGSVAMLVLLLAGLCCFWALLVSVVLGVKHRFRVAESARGLLPVSVMLVSVWTLYSSSFKASSEGFTPGLPLVVSVVLAFVSPLLALAWSLWDLRHLQLTVGIFTPRQGSFG